MDLWCDVDQLTLGERWQRVESGTLERRTRQRLGAAIPQWKLLRSCGSVDLYDEDTTAAVAARTPSTFSTKNSASLSTMMSVEAFIT